jgi:hypothetical protein
MNTPGQFCGHCGGKISSEDRFCGHCGQATDNIPNQSRVQHSSPALTKKSSVGKTLTFSALIILLLFVFAYLGSSWYIHNRISKKYYTGAKIMLGKDLRLEITEYKSGFFHSTAYGEIEFLKNGKIQKLFPVEQKIYQGILPNGGVLHISTFLPVDSKLYKTLTEGPLAIQWENNKRPITLNTTIYVDGKEVNVLNISNASSDIQGHSAEWQGVELSAIKKHKNNYQITYHVEKFSLVDPLHHENISMTNLEGKYHLKPVASDQIQLSADLELGPSQFGSVMIHKISSASELTAPMTLYTALQSQANHDSQNLTPSQMNEFYAKQQNLLMHSPLSYQIKHLSIDAGNGADFTAHLQFSTQSLASLHEQNGGSPMNLSWPTGNQLDVSLHASKPLLQQLLVFTETDYGRQTATPEQQLLAKQVVDQLATNPLFKNDDNNLVLHIRAEHQQLKINHQSLRTAASDLISAVALYDSMQQNSNG